MTFEQLEAALYAQPRIEALTLRQEIENDPRTRFDCTCERLKVTSFMIGGGKLPGVRWQCSDKHDHISWQADIAGSAARLRGLRNEV